MEGIGWPRSKDPYEPDGQKYGNALEHLRTDNEQGLLVVSGEESYPDKKRGVAFELRIGLEGMRELIETYCDGDLARLKSLQAELLLIESDILRRKGVTARV